ncbi:unnamed protein product [Sphacelaria rigidula]
MEAMDIEFDGFLATGTFEEAAGSFEGCDIVDAKWLCRWKCDLHDMVDRATARMVAMGYSQVEGVDYFEDAFAPTASATSNRLVAALSCKLGWDLRHLNADLTFIQSELDTEVRIVRPNKAFYGLKQRSRAWNQVSLPILIECGFDQCLVGSCVFRVRVAGDVVVMMVFHVDDIKIAAAEEVTQVVQLAPFISDFSPNILGVLTSWGGMSKRGTGREVLWVLHKSISFEEF